MLRSQQRGVIPKEVPIAKKRIFLLLLVLNGLVVLAISFFLWKLTYLGLAAIHYRLPELLLLALIVFHCTIILGFILTIVTLIHGREIVLSQPLRKLLLKVCLPWTIFLGKLIGVPRETIQQSFLEVNNHLIEAKEFNFAVEDVLLLLPQCLQNTDCLVRITRNIADCRQCGRCRIGDIKQLTEEYDIFACVATGGTRARKIIVDRNPKAIVAVACERDLVSGIQDSYPLPVFGILNKRPYGPCINTDVEIDKIVSALKHFLAIKELKAARVVIPQPLKQRQATN